MHHEAQQPNNKQFEPKENDIITCTFMEHGIPTNIAVRVVERFSQKPLDGYLYVEIVQNLGVFTYTHVASIVPDESIPSV